MSFPLAATAAKLVLVSSAVSQRVYMPGFYTATIKFTFILMSLCFVSPVCCLRFVLSLFRHSMCRLFVELLFDCASICISL